MEDWSEGYIETNDLQIHYHRTGNSGRTAIVLLHGIMDNGLCWNRVANDLERQYDVIMPDARGHGKTRGPVGQIVTYEMLANDLLALLDGLNLQDPFLFGHSMGAMTAATLAARHPKRVRGIALEDPPLIDPQQGQDRGNTSQVWQQLLALGQLPREDRLRQATRLNPNWVEEENIPWADSKAECDQAMLQALDVFVPWRGTLSQISIPVLLLTGSPEAHAITTQDLAQEAANFWPQQGEWVHIVGAGHCIHRDRYEASITAVKSFLNAH